MRVVAVGGEPATGKSRLLKELIKELGPGPLAKCGTAVYHNYPAQRLLILGDYGGGHPFPGTDRLSMSVQPTMLGFLRALAKEEKGAGPPPPEWKVLFEGDRLFNRSFLTDLKAFAAVRVALLVAPDAVLEARHRARGDRQTGVWLRGRKAKAARVGKLFEAAVWPHRTPADTQECLGELRSLLGIEGGRPPGVE